VKITPLPLRPFRDHALLFPEHRSLTIDTRWGRGRFTGRRQIENALAKLKGFQCYVTGGLERLKHTTGATSWTMETWKQREVAMIHEPSGVKVVGVRQALANSTQPFEDLTRCLDWLAMYGVRPGTVSSMAWQLFRASLDHEIVIAVDPALSHPSFFGGRQSCKAPKVYKRQKLVDIRRAYPFQMSHRPYALAVRGVDPTTELDPDAAGLARATVWVPQDLPYPPLPVRVGPEAIQFRWGEVEGIYAWRELAAAIELGCKVTVHESWAPRRELDLFGPWWILAQTGGEDPLAKAITVCTWGQFAMDGQGKGVTRWVDDAGEVTFTERIDARPMPHAWMKHIAAETTARVRTQTLLEGLYGMGGAPPCHVDTDGVIVQRSAQLPANTGDGYGQWRVKETMKEVEIKAPQFYRYTCFFCGLEHSTWHYCASGMNEQQAAETFKRTGKLHTRVSFLSNEDKVLPDVASFDHDRITRLIKEARAMGVDVGE
jgi:hypothetical protein